MKIVAGIVSALVLSNLALAVMLMQRQEESTDRLARLERIVEKGQKGVERIDARLEASDRKVDQLGEDLQRASVPPAGGAAPAIEAAKAPAATAVLRGPEPLPSTSPLSESQRDAVKKEVEEAVKARLGHMPTPEEMNDPLAVLEKELDLNAYQKTRIKDLMDEMQGEILKLVTGSIDPKDPEKFDFSKINDLMAMQKGYDGKIAQELDSSQLEKYAALKKQGRLPSLAGANIRFAVSSSGPEKK